MLDIPDGLVVAKFNESSELTNFAEIKMSPTVRRDAMLSPDAYMVKRALVYVMPQNAVCADTGCYGMMCVAWGSHETEVTFRAVPQTKRLSLSPRIAKVVHADYQKFDNTFKPSKVVLLDKYDNGFWFNDLYSYHFPELINNNVIVEYDSLWGEEYILVPGFGKEVFQQEVFQAIRNRLTNKKDLAAYKKMIEVLEKSLALVPPGFGE